MTDRPLTLEPVPCGVCAADNCDNIARGMDYEYRTSEDHFQMVECRGCGNVYLNPRPALTELPRIYPDNYYAYNYDQSVHPIARKAKDFLDRMKVKSWLKHSSSATPRFLDVGCGNGRYLSMMHSMGVPKSQLYGVEMSQKSIDQLKANGYRGFNGRIEDVAAELPAEGFDLVVLLQVLEHVDSPREVMRSISGLLNPGGVLIVETPNTDSLDVRLFRKGYWGGYHFPRHWNLFNRQTLRRLADEQGLEVKEIRFLPSHSFWIFSYHHLIENGWGMSRLARLFNPLRNLALLSCFTAFDLIRAKLGFRTSNIQIVLAKN